MSVQSQQHRIRRLNPLPFIHNSCLPHNLLPRQQRVHRLDIPQKILLIHRCAKLVRALPPRPERQVIQAEGVRFELVAGGEFFGVGNNVGDGGVVQGVGYLDEVGEGLEAWGLVEYVCVLGGGDDGVGFWDSLVATFEQRILVVSAEWSRGGPA